MTEPEFELPALYKSADAASTEAQNGFWWMIRAEYLLLLIVAILSSTRGNFEYSLIIITTILVVLGGLFVFKVHHRPEQKWYRCRALAESVKTSTWRFAMRAHPFQDARNIDQPKAEFRNLLHDILKVNHDLAEGLRFGDANQFTPSMLEVRQLSVNDRLAYYVRNRIDDQRKWYSYKSENNRKCFKIWFWLTIFIYICTVISLHADQLNLSFATYAFDPLVVVVTSVIGWVQIKRYSELTASYNLTAHEIGIIRSDSESISTEEDLSNFVNEAELAFSREHTQWVARRDVN